MAGSEGDKGTTWQGGSLDDLLALLAEGSWSARIEAVRGPLRSGYIDVIAGGVAETHAGDLRGDRALAALRAPPEPTYRVELRLPHPTLGGIDPPGAREGSIADRPVAALMRYCEEFVLTGALLLRREDKVARIVYRRGEIATMVVDGSEDPDRLTEVMGWRNGTFVIDVEGPTLPTRMPAPKPGAAGKDAPTTLFGYPTPGLAAAAMGVVSPTRATPRVPVPAVRDSGAPVTTAKGGDRPIPGDPASTRPTARAPMPAVGGPSSASQRPTPRSGSSAPPAAARPTPPGQPAQSAQSGQTKPAPAPSAMVPAPTAPAPIPLSKTPPPRPTQPAAQEIESEPTGYLSQPLIVHVLVGAAVGALVVIAYWAYLRGLPVA